jgi:hypothetical protein
MRSGVTLANLRNEVLIEAGFSTETGHATAIAPRINQLLQRHQRMMMKENDWPAVGGYEATVTIAADASTGTLPSNLTYTDIGSAYVLYGTQWLPLKLGIGPEERSIYSSAQRSVPIQKWELVPGTTTFEVWPIGSVEQTVRFQGNKSLGAFSSDSDTCTLDGDVLVLRVAAEILGRDKKEDAALKLRAAKELTEAILKRDGGTKAGQIRLDMRPKRMLRAGIDFIPPGYGS